MIQHPAFSCLGLPQLACQGKWDLREPFPQETDSSLGGSEALRGESEAGHPPDLQLSVLPCCLHPNPSVFQASVPQRDLTSWVRSLVATATLRGAVWEGHRAFWVVSREQDTKTVRDGPGTAKAAASLHSARLPAKHLV